jgi:dTDP-4-dehydrorhamnose 3,5-epimerase
MEITSLAIPEVLLIEPDVHKDFRGFFIETYQAQKYADCGFPQVFVQDNHTGSRRGTLRGLHYQLHQVQAKLIRVAVGEIFDVAVDLRQSSKTFGKWVGITLSAEDHQQLWIPKGFAHGFLVLSAWAEVEYKVSDFYAPEWERTLLWNDPEINIKWPLKENQSPILSEKDSEGILLAHAEVFV